MTEFHDPQEEHLLLGAYILGGLSASERADFELHAAGCAECRDEIKSSAGLPALLGTLGYADASYLMAANPPATAPDEYPELMVRLAAKRRNERLKYSAFALAAVAAALVAGVFLAPTLRPAPTPDARFAAASELGPRVEVGMNSKAWGTELKFSGAGLPTSGTLSLWVVDRQGTADQAGSWQATQTGTTKLTGAVPTKLGNIATVQLRDVDSKVLAVMTLPGDPGARS